MSSIRHVAIIMDGNGRWAKQRFRPRIWGHVRGANRVSAIVDEAARLGLESLTLYTFSTENWSRPTDEITNLFKILKKFLQKEKKNLIKNNIKFDVIGNYRVLDTKIVQIIDDIKYKTEKNTGLNLSLAINYGGRAEIVDAVNVFFKENRTREITEKDITEYLYNTNLTNIDLLIRTAGDTRISNFLLWQISYAELFFTETKWPEFTVDEFRQILQSVSGKERKFGSIENDTSLSHSKEKAQHNLKILS
jgi:undecaprenyl diphosphate synthase